MRHVLAAFLIFMSLTSHAMDLTGIDLGEIPIPDDVQGEADRMAINGAVDAELLKIAKPVSELRQMTMPQLKLYVLQLQVLRLVQAEAINKTYAEETVRDDAYVDLIHPDDACAARFGNGYTYSSIVGREDPITRVHHNSILCMSEGPSRRTAREKLMIAIGARVQSVRKYVADLNPFRR